MPIPRIAYLRRMACGKWKLNNKTYRTRALAQAAALRRGLWIVARVSSSFRWPEPAPPWNAPYSEPSKAPWLAAAARSTSRVCVLADPHVRPGASVYVWTGGERAGTFTSDAREGAVKVEGARFESVRHEGSTATGLRSTALLSLPPQGPA